MALSAETDPSSEQLLKGPDVWGAVMVASVGLAVATVLSTAAAVLLRQEGMTTFDVVSLAAALIGATFGAGYSGSHETVMTSATSTFELGAHGTPLLFTILVLSSMSGLFKRRTAAYSSVTPAVREAFLVALLTAMPVFVLSLVVRNDADDITAIMTGERGSAEGTYGVSRPAALIVTLVLVFTVLALSCVTRRDWLGESTRLHDLLSAPLRGFVALLWSLPVLGALAFALMLIPVGDSDSVRWEHVRDDKPLAAGIAMTASANAGLDLLGLGLGAPAGVTAEFGGIARSMADSADGGRGLGPLDRTRLGTWAEREPGLVVAPIVALVTLAIAAFKVLSRSSRPRRKGDLARWVIGLGLTAPVMIWLGSVRYQADARLQSERGGLPPISADSTWSFGLDPLQFTVTLVVGAAAMALLALGLENDSSRSSAA